MAELVEVSLYIYIYIDELSYALRMWIATCFGKFLQMWGLGGNLDDCGHLNFFELFTNKKG